MAPLLEILDKAPRYLMVLVDRALAQHAAVEFCSAPGMEDLVAATERF